MAHTTHEQSRQRNEKFAEFIKSEEVQQQMKTISKSKCLGFLREQFKEKYNISIPASAAYRVMASIDDRFKPKSRVQTQETVTNKTSSEIVNESVDEIINENPEVNEFITQIQRIRENVEVD